MSYRPLWDGVVMIERLDPTKTPHVPFGGAACRVISARSATLGGLRAISEVMPYAAVKDRFTSDDDDHIFVRAELHGTYLQLHERCTLKEWAETCHVSPQTH